MNPSLYLNAETRDNGPPGIDKVLSLLQSELLSATESNGNNENSQVLTKKEIIHLIQLIRVSEIQLYCANACDSSLHQNRSASLSKESDRQKLCDFISSKTHDIDLWRSYIKGRA